MTSPAGSAPAAASVSDRDARFAFGRNWARFSRHVTDERIAAAEENLRRLLEVGADSPEPLAGLTMLDIGCGSGLASLAALRLGARVVAFDYDADSVATASTLLADRAPERADYRVQPGSVLDHGLMAGLGTFDIVHAWGVLHHTGALWAAVDRAAAAVAPGGRLALALYNDQGGASRRWAAIKRAYVRGPAPVRWLLVAGVGTWFETRAALIRALRLQNPLPFADWRQRRQDRGMSVWHDLVDWVGGHPFEVARPEEVLAHLRPQGFELTFLKTVGGGHGCNEYLFRKGSVGPTVG